MTPDDDDLVMWVETVTYQEAWLPRGRLEELCERLEADPNAPVQDLLTFPPVESSAAAFELTGGDDLGRPWG